MKVMLAPMEGVVDHLDERYALLAWAASINVLLNLLGLWTKKLPKKRLSIDYVRNFIMVEKRHQGACACSITRAAPQVAC